MRKRCRVFGRKAIIGTKGSGVMRDTKQKRELKISNRTRKQPLKLLKLDRSSDEFLGKVAKAFPEAIKYEVSEEHSQVLKKAISEKTNENIELSKRMKKQQQKAFILRNPRY